MIRNPKVLLLAGLAVLALSAIGASAASANFTTEYTTVTNFITEPGSTILTTEQDGSGTTAHLVVDVPNNGSITCNAADLEGTVAVEKSTSITLKGVGATPFTGCSFLGQPATVELNGCGFEFKVPTTVSVVSCNAGKEITFSAAGCTVHVPEQSLVGHSKGRNLGTSGKDMYVTVESLITNVKSNATGAGCIKVGETTTGTFTTANFILKGHVNPSGAQKPVTVS